MLAGRMVKIVPALMLWLSASLFYMQQYAFRVTPITLRTSLIDNFSLTITDVAQLTAFLFYAYLAMTLLAGVIIRAVGKEKMLLIAVCCNQLAILLITGASGYSTLIWAEILFGLSGAFSLNIALSFAREADVQKRLLSLTSLTFIMGMVGVFLGGWPVQRLSEEMGWRSALLLFSFINLIVLVVGYFGYSTKTSISKPSHTVSMPTDGKSPYKSWLVWSQNLYVCFQFLANSAFVIVWAVPFAHLELFFFKPDSIFATPVVFIGLTLGFFVFGRLSYTSNNTKRQLMMISSLVASLVALGIIYEKHIHIIVLFPMLLVLGFLMASYILATTIIQSHVHGKYINPILAIHVFFINIGGAVTLTLINALLKRHFSMLGENNIHAYHLSLFMIPVSFVLAFLVAYCMPRDK